MSLLIIILVLFVAKATYIQGKDLKKVSCDYNDETCLTKSTDVIFTKIVEGIPGVESSDPLNKDVIKLVFANLKFELRNAKLTGLRHCKVEDVKVNTKELAFDYFIQCPFLTIESEYKLLGKLDGVPVEGTGPSKVNYQNCHLILIGNYAKHFDKNGLLHTNITNYELEVRVEGNIVNDYEGLSSGDEKTAAKFMKTLEEIVRKPVMDSFIKKYVENINNFLKIVPVEDIHFQYA